MITTFREKLTMNSEQVVKPEVMPFFDAPSHTFSYIVKDPTSSVCAIVDSVLGFDYASGTIGYQGANEIIRFIQEQDLELKYLIETHVHADHLSAAPYIQSCLGGSIMISKHISEVQKVFASTFNEGPEFQKDGSQFDKLLEDGENYSIGALNACALHTPGHTPACMTHVIGDAGFVGDTLFMPDGGTARADFPGGNARMLYRSIQTVLSLPHETRLFMCHDYQPDGRKLECMTTVGEQKAANVHVGQGISEEEFVSMRQNRDKSLGMPKLIMPSLQVNMRAGHFPPAEDNDITYLKVPITGLIKLFSGPHFS